MLWFVFHLSVKCFDRSSLFHLLCDYPVCSHEKCRICAYFSLFTDFQYNEMVSCNPQNVSVFLLVFIFLQIVLWTHRFQHTGILIHYPYYLCWSSTSPIFARADLFEFATGPLLCDPRGLWQLWSYVELHSILG